MTKPILPLNTTDRIAAVRSIIMLLRKLDDAGEALAAVHLSHALDCLDPDSSIARGIAGEAQ